MKKIILITLSCLLSLLSPIALALPDIATVNFTLSQIERDNNCPALLNNAQAVVRYEYDFRRNVGFALIKQLQATRWTEILHPLGLTNLYGFMSDIPPTTVHLNGGDVVVYRVIFNLQFNGDAQLALMIGQQGECILRSNIVNVNQ